MIKGGFVVIIITALWGCARDNAPNKFSDATLVKIADFQDRRQSDSLVYFLSDTDADYRSAAALAFSSVQDTLKASALGSLLLEDSSVDVRRDAAFALGQTGGIAAVNALIPALNDGNPVVVREVLEALGKTVTTNDVSVLKSFVANDSLSAEGLAWAYYRLSLRKLSDSLITSREMIFLNPKYGFATRLGAAQYFNRVSHKGTFFENELIESALHDVEAEVRMNSISGIKKLPADKAIPTLETALKSEKDPRARVNIIRACSSFLLKETQGILFNALGDSSINVRVAASELILRVSSKELAGKILEQAKKAKDVRVKANLYSAWLTVLPDAPVDDIIRLYESANNYGKADWLTSLGYAHGKNEKSAFDFISKRTLESKIPVIKSTGSAALVTMSKHQPFFNAEKNAFVDVYKKLIADGDAAVVGTIASDLADSTLGFRSVISDISFLRQARGLLRLPKDIESLQPLEEAIAFFEGKPKPLPLKNAFNHPIAWEKVKAIGSGQRVLVKTGRGEITLRLFVDEAPGSVANFVELIQKKYYDGRFFHRVVPNFVVQTGCNRGDGFGSEDYSIRSEFSRRRYKTGSVGYASAGKDTEGTQWFITHSSTPHLDGRYTIFAEVESGMDVAEQLIVGDSIIEVSLIKDR